MYKSWFGTNLCPPNDPVFETFWQACMWCHIGYLQQQHRDAEQHGSQKGAPFPSPRFQAREPSTFAENDSLLAVR
jgi:hypothetical protein